MQRALTHPAALAALALTLAVAAGAALVASVDWSVRWTIYLFVVPFLGAGLLLVRDRGVLTLALFGPLILLEGVAISPRNVGPFRVGVALAAFAAVFAVALWHGARPRHIRGHLPALGLFVLLALVAALGAEDASGVQISRFQTLYLQGAGFFVLGATLYRDDEEAGRGLLGLLAIGLFLSLLQALHYATGALWLAPPLVDPESGYAWRYGGPLINPNTLADTFAMLIPISVLVVASARRTRWRVAGVALTAVFSASIFLTGSRGGAFAGLAGVGLGLGLVALQRRRGLAVLPVALVVLVAASGALDRIFPDVYQASVERWQERGLEDVRTEIWAASVRMSFDYPLGFGHDPLEFASQLTRYAPNQYWATPHNIYLSIALACGIPAALAFLWIVGRALLAGVRTLRRPLPRRAFFVRASLWIGVAVFLVAGVTEPIYDNGYKLNHLFWFMLGAGVRLWATPATRPDELAPSLGGPAARGASSAVSKDRRELNPPRLPSGAPEDPGP